MTNSAQISTPPLIRSRYALHPGPKQGRLADVFKASDIGDNGRTVAVKLFRSGLVNDAVIREAFDRESSILTDLRHDRIIALKDFGIDETTSRPFLILEWGGEDLTSCIDKSTVSDWDTFYDAFGRAILEGLAYAHQQGVVHRDIKPNDLLRADDGTVRLADFGIAKYREFIDTNLSIDDFKTEPFTPPNGYDPSFSYTTDVYGFAAVTLDFLSTVPLKSWNDLGKALAEVQAPTDVLDLLEEAISNDPSERPLDATVLLSQLDRIQSIRRREAATRRVCHLAWTRNAIDGLRATEGIETEAEATALVIRDLGESRAVRPYEAQDEQTGEWKPRPEHFFLYGANLRLHIAVDGRSRASLVILSARRPYSAASVEQDREKGWDPPYDFRVGAPASLDFGQETTRSFCRGLERFEEEVRERDAIEAEGRLFRAWSDLLQVRMDHVDGKASLRFLHRTIEGRRVTLLIEGPVDALIMDETWLIHVSANGVIKGVVEEVDDNTVVLYIEDGNTNLIPASGAMSIDARSTRSALKKQRDALEAVRSGIVPRPDLKDLLLHPADCSVRESANIQEWFFAELDQEKKEAVRAALAAQDFFVVEGPPGTGKTSFIAELILQYLKLFPGKRVLLTAQTHIAVDNAIDRVIKLKPELRVIRVGQQEQKVAATTQRFLLQNRVKEWGHGVRERAIEFIQNWAEDSGIAFSEVQLGVELGALIGLLQEVDEEESIEKALKAQIDEIILQLEVNGKGEQLDLDTTAASELAEKKELLEEQLSENTKQLRSLRSAVKDAKEQLRKLGGSANALADEPLSELIEWREQLIGSAPGNEMFRNLLEISNEWIKRFGVGQDCYEAILAASDLVSGTCIGIAGVSEGDLGTFDLCIFDEASKATPTETLVPLSRSKKWVMVGDPKQLPPFVDAALRDQKVLAQYEIDQGAVRDTILARLQPRLPDNLRARLTVQHRMTRAIGDLISSVFYPEGLSSVHSNLNPHISRVLPKPVTWFTTSRMTDRFEHPSGASQVNQREAVEILKIIGRIEFFAAASRKKPSQAKGLDLARPIEIVVLSGYAAQRDLIESLLSKERSGWQNVVAQCETVDSFQGREADLAVLSITRSNQRGNPGFLRERERINVALSRGKFGLCIVGDHEFCEAGNRHNALADVVAYIKSHAETCVIEEINNDPK